MERVLVSACLLGCECRYDGRGAFAPKINEILRTCEVVAVCPEVAGGMPIPRPPVELVDGRARTKEGHDYTEELIRGAATVTEQATRLGIRRAILKSNSPSCGSSMICDGTFSGKKIKGEGLTARMLREAGVEVISEQELQ